ncbi:MAG: tetratricopeptide repeat protein [Thalassobaculales bacterium]
MNPAAAYLKRALAAGPAASLGWYARLLALVPGLAPVYANLAAQHLALGAPLAAERAARRALGLQPSAGAWNNLGIALQELGEAEAAVAAFRAAVAADPASLAAGCNLVAALHLLPEGRPACHAGVLADWNRRFAAPLLPAAAQHPGRRDPGRILRVGYVAAGGFRHHTAAYTALPLIEAHDRAAVEPWCYSDLPPAGEDAVSARFRAAARWRVTHGLDDEAFAETLRQDRIDILVDLYGYPQGTRLLAFARRPAPVQMTLIPMSTTGLAAIDATVLDEAMLTPEIRASFSERIFTLPHGFLAVPPVAMPEPALLPGRPFTFGSLNQPAKIGPAVADAWSRILAAVPGSRLLLKARAFADRAAAERFAARFLARGVARDRLDLLAWAADSLDHARTYARIDVALDPFPYAGVITTCDALWMGVPVVALEGDRLLGRFGPGFLRQMGLGHWVARDVEDYVRIAVELAADRAGLAALRGSLRQRYLASPLADAATFARGVEGVYRQLWREWCGG